MNKKKISILGSTGSIGIQALQVVDEFPDQFEIIGLSAGKNIELLKKQILKYHPKIVSVLLEKDAEEIAQFVAQFEFKIEVFFGKYGLLKVALEKENEFLLIAIVGTTALRPAYEAIKKKITIGLASKEILVAGGDMIMQLAKEKNTPILPVDSEHAALRQCLEAVKQDVSLVKKIFLTASGGPFWNKPKSEFGKIQKKHALKHPNWDMGAKITIDSATLMNKGLEIIEAHHLFGIEFEKIVPIIHPQSIVHAMAEFNDGTYLAQMSMPDMRFPIVYAMMYPKKENNSWSKLDLTQLSKLEFIEPDFDKFSLLGLSIEAGKKGGGAPVILNASNEGAVKLFLEEKIKFLDIMKIVTQMMKDFSNKVIKTFSDIEELDKEVREYVIRKFG